MYCIYVPNLYSYCIDWYYVCHLVQSFVNLTFPELQGGPLSDKFKLEQFHLHWGSCDDHGSEHTIDGQTYASEVGSQNFRPPSQLRLFSKLSPSSLIAALRISVSSTLPSPFATPPPPPLHHQHY